MLAPLLFSLIACRPLATGFQTTVAESSEYLEYRTWQGQHWRLKAIEPTKLLIQHMPDEKKVSEEKTVDVIQYKTGSGAKYSAFIEEKTEKGVKSFVLRHVSENGKDNHLDTHISYAGWDNTAHIAVIVNKDGKIFWSISSPEKTTTTGSTPATSTDKKPAPVKPSTEPKPKTSG